jgi:hypothetical protein
VAPVARLRAVQSRSVVNDHYPVAEDDPARARILAAEKGCVLDLPQMLSHQGLNSEEKRAVAESALKRLISCPFDQDAIPAQ